MHSVIMHTLQNGALLTITESTGYARRHYAALHAAKCAREYAARHEGAFVRKGAALRWTIHNAGGYTFAQFDVQ